MRHPRFRTGQFSCWCNGSIPIVIDSNYCSTSSLDYWVNGTIGPIVCPSQEINQNIFFETKVRDCQTFGETALVTGFRIRQTSAFIWPLEARNFSVTFTNTCTDIILPKLVHRIDLGSCTWLGQGCLPVIANLQFIDLSRFNFLANGGPVLTISQTCWKEFLKDTISFAQTSSHLQTYVSSLSQRWIFSFRLYTDLVDITNNTFLERGLLSTIDLRSFGTDVYKFVPTENLRQKIEIQNSTDLLQSYLLRAHVTIKIRTFVFDAIGNEERKVQTITFDQSLSCLQNHQSFSIQTITFNQTINDVQGIFYQESLKNSVTFQNILGCEQERFYALIGFAFGAAVTTHQFDATVITDFLNQVTRFNQSTTEVFYNVFLEPVRYSVQFNQNISDVFLGTLVELIEHTIQFIQPNISILDINLDYPFQYNVVNLRFANSQFYITNDFFFENYTDSSGFLLIKSPISLTDYEIQARLKKGKETIDLTKSTCLLMNQFIYVFLNKSLFTEPATNLLEVSLVKEDIKSELAIVIQTNKSLL